jgi:hypothetical protein
MKHPHQSNWSMCQTFGLKIGSSRVLSEDRLRKRTRKVQCLTHLPQMRMKSKLSRPLSQSVVSRLTQLVSVSDFYKTMKSESCEFESHVGRVFWTFWRFLIFFLVKENRLRYFSCRSDAFWWSYKDIKLGEHTEWEGQRMALDPLLFRATWQCVQHRWGVRDCK